MLPQMTVALDAPQIDPNCVSCSIGDRVFFRYRYKDVPFKPYFQELCSPDGINILRDAPFDHLHHHGLMYAVAVDGVNFWEERPTSGRQLHRSFSKIKSAKSGTGISFSETLDWIGPDDQKP